MVSNEQIQKNKQIVDYVKAFLRLPANERTKAKALEIFKLLNTNKNGNSKDRLDNLDAIDDYFKQVMGLTVMHNITQDEFLDNIDEWATDFTKYKAPAPKPETPTPPIPKANQTKARTLANNLVKSMAPNGQTSEVGVAVAENTFGAAVAGGAGAGAVAGAVVTSWSGGWGAIIGGIGGAVVGGIAYLCSDSDKERYEKAYELFGEGSDKINKDNIVEVMRYVNPDILNRVIDTLDNGDDSTIRQTIAQAFEDRITTLKKAKFISAEEAKELLDATACLETDTNFKENLVGLWRTLSGVGVKQ